MDDEIIYPGDWVVIQRENFVKVHKVTPSAVAMLGRDCVELENLLGQPRWSTYYLEEKGKKEVRKFSLKKCDSLEFEEEVADSLVDDSADDSKTNRFIRDDGQSQKLSKEEIEGMQSDGASAKQIIGQLVENSVTFDQKSSYAQEKYVKKKQKKYKRVILVRPTCLRLILQAILGPSNDASKILGLRIDSLSQLVYMSGAQSGAGLSTFLVFDSGSQGVVTAAVLERLGSDPEAHLIVLGPVRGNNKALAIQAMNFPPNQLCRVHHVSLAGLLNRAREDGLIPASFFESVKAESMDLSESTDNSESNNSAMVESAIIAMEDTPKEPATDNSPSNSNKVDPITVTSAPEGSDSKESATDNSASNSSKVGPVKYAPEGSDSKQSSADENSTAADKVDSKQPSTVNSSTNATPVEPETVKPDLKQPMTVNASSNSTPSVIGAPEVSDNHSPMDSSPSVETKQDSQGTKDGFIKPANLKRPLTDNPEPTILKRNFSSEDYELNVCMDRLRRCKANGLLIVGKENPAEITEGLLPLVSASRPVVLFSQFREPLHEMYMKLKGMKNVTALRLSEPWLRKYQVLSERTHPEVMMSSSGGYLLTGLTVDPQ